MYRLVLVAMLFFRIMASEESTSHLAAGHNFNSSLNIDICRLAWIGLRPRGKEVDFGKVISDLILKMRKHGGGSVYVYPGEYTIATPIRLASRTCLIGAGMDSTVLLGLVNDSAVIQGDRTTKITLRGFELDLSQSSGKGIEVEEASETLILGVKFVGARESAIVVRGSPTTFARNVLVDRVVIDAPRGFGVSLIHAAHVTIRNSYVLAPTVHGLDAVDSKMIRFERNTVVDAGGGGYVGACGVTLLRIEQAEVFGNRVHNARHAAACIWSCQHVLLKRHRVSNERWPESRCIELHDSTEIHADRTDCKEKNLLEL